MKGYKTYEFKGFVVTVIVLLGIMAMSFLLAYRLGKMEEQRCLDLFRESADQIACSVEQKLDYARDSLKTLENLIQDSDSLESEEVKKILDGFCAQDIFCDVGILLPDDTIIMPYDREQKGMSFEGESRLGFHIEGEKEGESSLTTFFPVKTEKEMAVLYGSMELQAMFQFPENSGLNEENTSIYLYDNINGNYVAGMGHQIPFSVAGHDAVSEITLDYLYFHDDFGEDREWEIIVAARRDIFFQSVENKWEKLNAWVLLEGIVFFGYLLWIFRNRKRVKQQARKQRLKFLSSFSHNIRTPLNAILGFSAIASKNIDDREQVLDCLNKIISSGEQMMALIDGHFAREKTGSDHGGGDGWEIPEKNGICRKEMADDQAEEKRAEQEVSLRGKRVLLVEDNELNREVASDFLSDLGIVVESAENGKIAVDLVKKSKPGYYDLIMMDIQMPVMDGYEAARQIRSMGRKDLDRIPIVAVTANAEEEIEDKLEQCGMDGYILKPLKEEKIEEMMRKLLRSARS